MEKEEKRRKFHEALLNKFYPPPPGQQPSHQDQNDNEEHEEPVILNLVNGSDDFDNSSLESEFSSDTSQSAPQKKLTRAQRKRLRKKKLKEAASRPRNKIIGPLLPSSEGGDGNGVDDDNESICNSVGELDAVIDKSGEKRSCASQNKLKHRRKVKRLNQSNVDCSNAGTGHQAQPSDDGSAL